MTFSIVARCPRTGEYGVGIATYSPNVGVRCPVVVPQRGAASLQAVANPYLLPIAQKLIASALTAEKIVSELLASDPRPESRQILIVDVYGRSFAYTGEKSPVWAGHITGDGYAVAGNVLASEAVVTAMAKAFEDSLNETLAERLMRSVEAGRDAGGSLKDRIPLRYWYMVNNLFQLSIYESNFMINPRPSCAEYGIGSAQWFHITCSAQLCQCPDGGSGVWTM